jgi:hypothetical protein
MWIMVDVRCVQMHKVEVVVMFAHAHAVMGHAAAFTAIVCLFEAGLRALFPVVRIEMVLHRGLLVLAREVPLC